MVVCLVLGAAVLGAAGTLVAHRGVVPAVRGEEALESAEMARRLARGEGFTTGVVYPAELWLGADAEHPAVKQPPLWPLVLAGPFALFGAEAAVARAALVALCAVLVAASAALAGARGGLVAGVVAALGVASSSANHLLALEPTSDTLFGVGVALALLLCARGAPPAWIGVACGLAYLTRYSGAVLLPMLLVVVALERRDARALAWCAAGFLAVALPWWIRNLLVAGNPFYSLQNLEPWVAPSPPAPGIGLYFQLEPDRSSAVAGDPINKLLAQLPILLGNLPFASANLAALAGVLLGCLRRDALCLALAGVGSAMLVCAALTMQMGGYLAPLFPAMIALGAAAWLRYGGWLRAPALALVLLAPVLPSWPPELRDLRQLRNLRDYFRDSGEGAESPEAVAALRGCLAGRPLVIAQSAPRIVWQADAVAIYAPVSADAFWRIVEEQPIAFAQRTSLGEISPERFEAEFAPRRDCAPDLYERRQAR